MTNSRTNDSNQRLAARFQALRSREAGAVGNERTYEDIAAAAGVEESWVADLGAGRYQGRSAEKLAAVAQALTGDPGAFFADPPEQPSRRQIETAAAALGDCLGGNTWIARSIVESSVRAYLAGRGR